MGKEFNVDQLGKCSVKSPLNLSTVEGDGIFDFIRDDERILCYNSLSKIKDQLEKGEEPLSFERAGPKEYIYFEPAKTRVAIVTCGGLCPGLNNVIRGIVNHIWERYGVKKIYGIQYGYSGFIPEYNFPYVELDPDVVDDIHKAGGTMLGSSRGNQSVETIVDTLERLNINILFTIGGDGTQRGAHAIAKEIKKRNLKISIAGIPKTIDNDINMIERSFGFETAFSIAMTVIQNAHYEAKGVYNGIAVIKLMGRDSGFIAANAALACPDVNFVLIPEMDFDLDGEKGFLTVLKKRLQEKQHAVIVVAEGAGQFFFQNDNGEDASGNKLYEDIGLYIRDKIREEFEASGFPFTMKYIDPSYILRSTPANANDSKFCFQLAQNAVHAAMAGRTDFVVGYWQGAFTVLPIPLATKERKKVNLEGNLWRSVLEATGQPICMKNDCP
ncbi:ATP-dependent 6-phosphofructokinase [uncultured Draconibacterium sp.]|uniref:ATP-dependent 6-phosphofructokinase n=1 Tax=uncultured Draconibacterium sp. TaxID=1573823 RepID=UPI002AA81ECC|nr:ATP-dependent 6-phosphofructokinase [uncultured Draconibacterium sp.]